MHRKRIDILYFKKFIVVTPGRWNLKINKTSDSTLLILVARNKKDRCMDPIR